MYFAIDEAGTHVGSKTFRLIAAVHDETGTSLLGTACSQPIRQAAHFGATVLVAAAPSAAFQG